VVKNQKAIDVVMESPGWKTFFSVVIPILTGVFSGSFILEITGQQGIEWLHFYKAKSFYALVVLTLIIFFYNRALYLREVETNKFSDVEFCVAYVRSKCLPEAAAKFREKIRQGQGGELIEVMEELKKSLK
jgi:hypothetical protein